MQANTALVVVDIQNDYFEGGANTLKGSLAAAQNAHKILAHVRTSMTPIVFIQHLGSEQSSFFKPGTKGAEIHDLVRPLGHEKLIVKHAPNGFLNTDLHAYLQENKIDNLVIIGMMSHMCIDATTRAASDLGYNCTVISDACATKDLHFENEKIEAEKVHQAFMAALGSAYANVMNTENWLVN